MKPWHLIFSLYLMIGCQNVPRTTHDDIIQDDAHSIEEGRKTFPLEFKSVLLQVVHDNIVQSTMSVLNLACDNVYSAMHPNDWTQNNVNVTSTFELVANKNCTVTLVSLNDGTNYIDTGTKLTINVSSSGVVSPAAAKKYTSSSPGPIFQWVAALQGQTNYSILMSYAADLVSNAQAPVSNLTGQAVSLSVSQVPAPVVSSLILYNIPSINSDAASYTLKGSISGYTDCKLINNTSNTYTPTSWSSVNSAYNAATVSCPVLVEGQAGFSIGNWTAYLGGGQINLVIWARSVNGLNAYAVANIGP